MRQLRVLLLSIIMGAATFAPFAAFAQESSVFGSIIPQSGVCTCPGSAPDWGCILQIVQNTITAGVGIAILVVVLAIAWAGFTFMTAGANPGRREQGRRLVTNAVIGLLVILAAWLFVDFLMKAVYDPETTFSSDTKLGPWNSIWAPGPEDMCLVVKDPEPLIGGLINIVTGDPIYSSSLGQAGAVCPDSKPCSVAAIQAQGVSESQARALSCIAMTESSGEPNAVNKSSLACGLFQITNKTSRSNWQNPQNHKPPCSVSTPCTDAACNLQTAVIMFKRSGYQPWTCSGCNSKAAACVAKYDPTAN